MTTPDDRELVERYLAGREETAFGALYERHTPAIWRAALRIAGRAADAEDVVQESWIRAASGLDRFRWGSTLRTWLVGIAINVARERRRSGAPERPELHLVATARPGTAVDLERALARLSPGYREVVVLHDVEGYTHDEIGEMLGIETGTSKSQLSRARRALRRALGARGVETA